MAKQKDAYYFSHDSNARNDEKILELRAEYGYEGYGLYWGIIEMLRDSSDNKLNYNSINSLSVALNFEREKLKIFIDDCIEKFKLFELKDDKYYSNRLLRNMKRYKQIGSKRSAIAKQMQRNKSKVKESKVNEMKVFSESPLFDFTLFKNKFCSNPKYVKYDVNFYYEAVKNWSESTGAKKKDWIATARGFAHRDDKENKAKLKPISYKSENNGKHDPSTAHL